MTLPAAPSKYTLQDQDTVRKILEDGLSGMVARILNLELAGATPPEPLPLGRPFGIFEGFTSSGLKSGASMYNYAVVSTSPADIQTWLQRAKDHGIRIELAMTGGNHDKYINSSTNAFDINYWKHGNPETSGGNLIWPNVGMDSYNTTPIKNAVASFAAQDVILGASVMDEPPHPSWGGVLDKAMVDEMADYARAIFPDIAWGVHVKHDWLTSQHFTSIDYINSQYIENRGEIHDFIAGGTAVAAADGIKINYDINLLNADNLVGGGCPEPQTGGPGGQADRCRVSPAQLETWGKLLGQAGTALSTWRWDSAMFSDPDYLVARNNVANFLSTLTRDNWFRP